jgi:hypothetical protein
MATGDRNIGQTIPLTEAEYAAAIEQRMDRVKDELNERLAGFLPPGMHFERAAPAEATDGP